VSAANRQPLLEIKALRKNFGGVRAVDGIDLVIGSGELCCIIGPNGAGKSTLFQLLSGQLMPTAGQIVFDGQEITRAQPFERARLGISVKVQNLGIFQDLTVDHNLRIPLMRRLSSNEIPQAIDSLLDQVGLSGLNAAHVRELSHGQKQWLALGMALAMQPKLLLLDEPTAGMSSQETKLTTQIIRAFNAGGSAVMVIEHDMAFVRELRAPVIVLHLGRVFFRGSFSEVEENEEVRHLYLGTDRKRKPPPGNLLLNGDHNVGNG
jgi:branched-chain amino acid transport system ATP-binding protein